MKKRAINRKLPAPAGGYYRESITFSGKELETMTEQDISEFLAAKAQQYENFVITQSALVSPEDDE
jgi:hypothetical protein